METWIGLLVIDRLLASTCPYTVKGIGQLLGFVSMIATIIFVVLTFIFASQWWYGLIACAIYFLIPMLTPRIDTNSSNIGLWWYSMIGSLLNPIIVVMMYISLFSDYLL